MSTIMGKVSCKAGTRFYNAMGTKDDEIDGYESILEAWEEYNPYSQVKCYNRYCKHNNDDIVGAHIVFKKPEGNIEWMDTCYILPLCKGCNHPDNDEQMNLSEDVNVLKIRYM